MPYKYTDRRKGMVRGEPARWLKGHNPSYKGFPPCDTRACRKCKKELPYTEEFFYRSISHLAGLAARCKECVDSANKAWREANPERAKQSCVEWRAIHREEILQYYRDWKIQNPEYSAAKTKEWREANDEKYREGARRWRKNNPQTARAAIILYKHKRRAASDEKITAGQLLEHFTKFNGLCGICDSHISLECANWDHIEPISKGGKHVLSNLQPVHGLCNSIKGARSLEHARNRVAELRQTGKFKEQ